MSLLLCFLLFFFSAIKSFPCHVTSLLCFNSAMTVCEFLVSSSLSTLLFVWLPCKDSMIPAVAKRLEDKSMLFTQFVFDGLYQLEVLIFFHLHLSTVMNQILLATCQQYAVLNKTRHIKYYGLHAVFQLVLVRSDYHCSCLPNAFFLGFFHTQNKQFTSVDFPIPPSLATMIFWAVPTLP